MEPDLLRAKDPLFPLGYLDVLPYYSKVASGLVSFLGARELCNKILIPNGPKLLKRGSQLAPLSAKELASAYDESFFQKRKKGLAEMRASLSVAQEKAWQYFYPRKLSELLYATNGEREGGAISRVFFDIDRKGQGAGDAQKVARALILEIREDRDFAKVAGKFDVRAMWTGSSFHVYLDLEKPRDHAFYDAHLQYTQEHPLGSFTGKWAARIGEEKGIPVVGGHARAKGKINIDPSQTPPGKLCRAPFSLHLKDGRNVDGVAVPVTERELQKPGLVRELRAYTPKRVLKEFGALSGKLKD